MKPAQLGNEYKDQIQGMNDQSLLQRYQQSRQQSLQACEPLAIDDFGLQPLDNQNRIALLEIMEDRNSHRKRRTKAGLASRLEAIPGIGPSKRKALLNHFGSIEKIKKTTIAELSAVQGITLDLANAIKDHLE